MFKNTANDISRFPSHTSTERRCVALYFEQLSYILSQILFVNNL